MTIRKQSILGMAGSLRRGSYNRALLRAAQELAPSWVEMSLCDIGQLPHFNEDVEAKGDPEAVTAFKEQIRRAQAVVIATPEYNGVVPGVLSNALDWASRPPGQSAFLGKPVAVMGAVQGDVAPANARKTVMGVPQRIGAIVVPAPWVLIPYADQHFDDRGVLRDAGTRQAVAQLIQTLARTSADMPDGSRVT